MNTLELAILIYVSLSLKMLVIAIWVIVQKMKLLPSGGAKKARSRGVKRGTTESQEKDKAMPSEIQGPRQNVPKTDGAVPSPHRVVTATTKRAESSKQVQTKNITQVMKPGPRPASAGAAGVQASATGQKGSVTPARQAQQSRTAEGQKKRIVIMSPASRNKAEERVEPGGTAKQINTGASAPIDGTEQKVSLKDIKIRAPLPGAPIGRYAVTELKDKGASVVEPSADISGQLNNDSPITVEPHVEEAKKDEANTDNVTAAESHRASPETPAETEDSDQKDGEDDKSDMGDLSDLFATSASEFAEKNILAEQVKEVDINVVLQEGLGLLDEVKKQKK